jgi:hypothetical protein
VVGAVILLPPRKPWCDHVVLGRSGHAEVSLTACRRAPAAHDRGLDGPDVLGDGI